MEISGVKIRDSYDIVARRVAKYFGFSAVGYSFGTVIYMKTRFQRKYKIFGLFSAIDFWEEADELGKFTKDWSVFDIKHPDNAPVAALLVKKFSEESKLQCAIAIVATDGKIIKYNHDDPNFLNIRRQFLEKEQLRFKQENERIELELAEVHQRLNELEGDGGPYRSLSAIK